MTHIRALLLGVLLTAAAFSGRPLAAQEPTWNKTLERIASGVVSIQIDSTRAFDTERNSSAQPTGFVVDAEHGWGVYPIKMVSEDEWLEERRARARAAVQAGAAQARRH